MITPGNSSRFKKALKKVMFDEMSLLSTVWFDKYIDDQVTLILQNVTLLYYIMQVYFIVI